MLKNILNWLLFANTMFFAAGAVVVDAGDAGAGDDGGGGGEFDDAGAGAADEIFEDAGGDEGDQGAEHVDDPDAEGAETEEQKAARGEERDAAEFKGQVSKRLVGLKQKSPKFAEALKESPELQSTLEATFRREAAYKELFPTVAEARQIREALPNGMQDVQALVEENQEVAELDRSFYGRDAQGNFSGHTELVNNLFTNDRDATVALFKTIPREWHRLDPESYNEVMGNIVGATLRSAQIGEWLTELRDTAKAGNQDVLTKELNKMLNWVGNFTQKKENVEEDKRTRATREALERQSRELKAQTFTRFKADFTSQSRALQNGILRKHSAIAEMLASKAIPEAKKTEIIEKVRKAIEGHLAKSPGFMNKLRPLYNAGKLKDTLDLQRAAWQYPWVVNKYVRQVMAAETPSLLKNNRERARGSAEAARRTTPANRGTERNKNQTVRTGPYQVGKQWFKKDGTPFSTAEVLRGAHLAT